MLCDVLSIFSVVGRMAQASIFEWGPARVVVIDREISLLRERLAWLEREHDAIQTLLSGGTTIEPLIPPPQKMPKTLAETILALMDDASVGWKPVDLITAGERKFGKSLKVGSVRVNLGRLALAGKVTKSGKLWYVAPGWRTTRPVRFR